MVSTSRPIGVREVVASAASVSGVARGETAANLWIFGPLSDWAATIQVLPNVNCIHSNAIKIFPLFFASPLTGCESERRPTTKLMPLPRARGGGGSRSSPARPKAGGCGCGGRHGRSRGLHSLTDRAALSSLNFHSTPRISPPISPQTITHCGLPSLPSHRGDD